VTGPDCFAAHDDATSDDEETQTDVVLKLTEKIEHRPIGSDIADATKLRDPKTISYKI